MKTKLTSRKFWLSAATLLGCIATLIEGVANQEPLVILGSLAAMVATTGLFNIPEAIIDTISMGSSDQAEEAPETEDGGEPENDFQIADIPGPYDGDELVE